VSASEDPTDVRTVVVTAEDVVAAFEATSQADREAVLRVTPPFSGRMRARLHVSEVVPGTEAAAEADPDDTGVAPVEMPPEKLLADAPPYPHPDDTEDEIRSDRTVEYTRERHRERHEAAVERWRERAREHVVEEVVVDTQRGATRSRCPSSVGESETPAVHK
jgi:hypothetical protein